MCKIPRCPNPAVAHGLCAKHYMRQRRHGDPTVTHPPGVDLAAWRRKVATLERALAQAQAQAATQPSAPCAACTAKDREIARLTAQLNGQGKPPPMPRTAAELAQAKLRAEAERKALREARRAAARAAKPAEIPDQKTKEDYERQIKSLRTQVRNQTAKLRELDRLMLQAVANKAVFASAEDRRFILAHFHPDRIKPGQRDQATRVFQMLNNIPVMDR